MEEVLFFGRWRVRMCWFFATTLAVHMGEEYRQFGQDSAWHQGRNAARCGVASGETSHCVCVERGRFYLVAESGGELERIRARLQRVGRECGVRRERVRIRSGRRGQECARFQVQGR